MGKLRNVFIDFSKMTTFWDFPKWNRGLTIWDGVSSSLPNRKKKKKICSSTNRKKFKYKLTTNSITTQLLKIYCLDKGTCNSNRSKFNNNLYNKTLIKKDNLNNKT